MIEGSLKRKRREKGVGRGRGRGREGLIILRGEVVAGINMGWGFQSEEKGVLWCLIGKRWWVSNCSYLDYFDKQRNGGFLD